jgi:site-specific DNA-methyltransferase (adenine-specific)
MRWLVQLVTREGQVVVDPFAGSGTTLLAADYLGRDWIGIERDDEHAELARRRVNNYDPSEVDDWIDDESVTQAEQATLGDMATDGGDG